MNRARFAALLLLIAVSACGKVGPPLPPIVRTPESVGDLQVRQNANRVILSWTNPGRYVDSNAATDLSEVRILQNGIEAARVPVEAAGQPQTYALDVMGNLDVELIFSLVVATRRGRTSGLSNVAPIRPREVPGAPLVQKSEFDQLRIILEWQPPAVRPELVAGYRVLRSDWSAARDVQATRFEDSEYEQDKTYTYTVSAVRADEETRIPGPSSDPRMITATDKTPPAIPGGLRIVALDTGGVLLEWTANTERDLGEYWVYRSDRTDPFKTRPEVFTDPDYRAGFSYEVSAVDIFGNESGRSMPLAGP